MKREISHWVITPYKHSKNPNVPPIPTIPATHEAVASGAPRAEHVSKAPVAVPPANPNPLKQSAKDTEPYEEGWIWLKRAITKMNAHIPKVFIFRFYIIVYDY